MRTNSMLTSRLRKVPRRLTAMACLIFGMIGLAIASTGFADFLKAIAQRESSLNPAAQNHGYMGLFQLGTMAMTDAGYYKPNGSGVNSWGGTFTGKDGLTSLGQFLSNPDLQVKAITSYYAKLQGYINYFGLSQYIGRTFNGVQMTASGLIAGAHLVGIGSLKQYLESGGTVVPRDGNNVPVTQYISQFGGYAISSVAPTYAQILASSPTGSVPISPPLPSPGGPGAAPAPVFATPPASSNPEAAFAANSGYNMSQILEGLQLMLGSTLFVWIAYMFVGAFQSYTAGLQTKMHVGKNNIRAIAVLLLFLAMLN